MKRKVIAPDDDPRFACSPDDYPQGPEVYWEHFDEAMTRFHREQRRIAIGLTDEQMREREAYYRLRPRVDKASKAMADAAGVDHRTFSLWLVRVKGFPWRRDCTMDDLRRLYVYLVDARNVEEARGVPTAPPGRGSGARYWADLGYPPPSGS
ncbi:hypothetical protein [Pseudonocardia sp. DLS-67]